MDLWQYNETRKVKRRIDDLTSVLFAFIAYEVGGLFTLFIYLLLEMVTRIITFYKEKKKKLGVVTSSSGDWISYRNIM
jgi:hypothetical protein